MACHTCVLHYLYTLSLFACFTSYLLYYFLLFQNCAFFCIILFFSRAEIKRKSPSYSPSASDSASNKDYDNARAFDNLGYSYSQPYAEKQPAVDDLPPPTNIIVDEERSHL